MVRCYIRRTFRLYLLFLSEHFLRTVRPRRRRARAGSFRFKRDCQRDVCSLPQRTGSRLFHSRRIQQRHGGDRQRQRRRLVCRHHPITVTATNGTTGHIQGSYVYFRSGPDTTYAIYDCLDNGTSLTITGYSGDWTAVTIGDSSGYVYSSYVVSDGVEVTVTPEPEPEPEPVPAETASETAGYIAGNDVRFRSGPSTQDAILGEYNYGTTLTITGYSGDWTAVTINDVAGYVYSQYVSEGRVAVIGDDPNASELGRQIVEYALQYEGYPYVWGGTSPSGFDCSGFTTYVFRHFGITLNRVACDQARNGVAVDTSALQPGDLLCFYSSADYIGHVGIYIGNNRFIHASTYTTGVIISELSGYYDTRGFIARRVI